MSEEFQLKFKAELEGKEQISDVFEGAIRDSDRFSARLKSAMSGAGGAISSFANKAGSELQAFAGKELGGSLGSQARGVLQLRDAITALAVSSGHGTEIVGGLKDQIQKASKASNQLQGDVTEAMSAFVERTSDLETARKNMEMWGRTATATGTAMKDIALVGETISTKFGVKDQGHVFDILVAQSKAKGGVIELHDIATKGPAIFAAAAAAGLSGEKGIREIGALTQLVAGSTGGQGTAAAASVSVGAIFSQIRQKADKIEGIGIKVQGRDMVEVLQDLIVKSKGDPYKLAEVFKNVRAFRGVEELAREYRAGHGFEKFEAFRDIGANPDAINADFATRNSTGMAKIRQQEVDRAAFVDKYAGGIAEWAAAHAAELQAGVFGAGLLGKGLGLVGRLGGALPGRVGDAVGAATAERVFVTNWPTGGVPGVPGSGSGGVLAGAAAIGVGATAAIVGGTAAVAGTMLAATAVHDKLLDVDMKAAAAARRETPQWKRNEEDLRAGRKRISSTWYGGSKYEDVAPDKQAQAARDYAALVKPPEVNITINSNENLEVKGDTGTRDPKVMDKRGGAN